MQLKTISLIAGIGLATMAASSEQYLNMSAIYANEQIEKSINSYLDQVLESVPSAAQARVGLIHLRIENSSSPEFLFDVAFVRTRQQFFQTQRIINLPLSQWSTYLDYLTDNKCRKIVLDQIGDQNVKERLASLNVKAYQGCPLWRENGFMIGAVFTFWFNDLPTDEQVSQSERALRKIAPRIAKQLESVR
jgi:ribosomal protein L22